MWCWTFLCLKRRTCIVTLKNRFRKSVYKRKINIHKIIHVTIKWRFFNGKQLDNDTQFTTQFTNYLYKRAFYRCYRDTPPIKKIVYFFSFLTNSSDNFRSVLRYWLSYLSVWVLTLPVHMTLFLKPKKFFTALIIRPMTSTKPFSLSLLSDIELIWVLGWTSLLF